MTPLFKKLNFKNHKTILALNAPTSFEEELIRMQNEATVFIDVDKIKSIDFVLVFVTQLVEIEKSIISIYNKLNSDIVLWYCYPKASSKRYKCEFNRDTGWQALGAHNLEPVRQVAIDEDWSALRFRKVEFIKTMTRSFAISEKGKSKAGKV